MKTTRLLVDNLPAQSRQGWVLTPITHLQHISVNHCPAPITTNLQQSRSCTNYNKSPPITVLSSNTIHSFKNDYPDHYLYMVCPPHIDPTVNTISMILNIRMYDAGTLVDTDYLPLRCHHFSPFVFLHYFC